MIQNPQLYDGYFGSEAKSAKQIETSNCFVINGFVDKCDGNFNFEFEFSKLDE